MFLKTDVVMSNEGGESWNDGVPGLMLFRNQGIVRDAPKFTAISWNGFGNRWTKLKQVLLVFVQYIQLFLYAFPLYEKSHMHSLEGPSREYIGKKLHTMRNLYVGKKP